jgi:oxygen-independent coproporphyrinogen-3 oxidase
MVYILANDNRIKTQDPYELVRAFYGDGDIEIIDMDKRDQTTLNSETVSISIEGDVYKVSLLRGNTLIDSEQMSYHQKDFYRGETASRNNTVKHLIYKILSRKLDTELPWGILTGIRPVKVSKMLMDKGLAQEDAIDILVDSYLLREDKARLITDVSLNQNPILAALKKNSYSIYVGIPFCPTRCFYCSFPTLITHKNKDIMEEYVNSLIEELEDTCSMMGSWDLNTVYIGGGTPTSLPKELMERLLDYINTRFEGIKELTVEAGRPDTIDREYIELLKNHKVNRISINPQTMDDVTLRIIGRNHSAKDIIDAYTLSKDIGIETVNMDLIVGLPGENRTNMEETLRTIRSLEPDNLTVHTLAVKKGSEFILDKGKYPIASGDEIQEMLYLASEFAKENKMIPYYLYRQKQILGNFENIGYSKKNNPCLYNVSIMEEKETIIGIGMGSTSKFYNKMEDSIDTFANFRSIRDYLGRLPEQKTLKRQKINKIEKSWCKLDLDTK